MKGFQELMAVTGLARNPKLGKKEQGKLTVKKAQATECPKSFKSDRLPWQVPENVPVLKVWGSVPLGT